MHILLDFQVVLEEDVISPSEGKYILDPTATNSHTSCSNLSSAEKDARMQNLHHSLTGH
jgi:hypothetical protein